MFLYLPHLNGIFIQLFFYWNIIAVHHFVSFCCTVQWISCMYTYIFSLFDLPPTLISAIQVVTDHRTELPVFYSGFLLATYFTYGTVCTSSLVSQFIPFFPSPLHSHVFSLHVHLNPCPGKRFICTIFLDSKYMC